MGATNFPASSLDFIIILFLALWFFEILSCPQTTLLEIVEFRVSIVINIVYIYFLVMVMVIKIDQDVSQCYFKGAFSRVLRWLALVTHWARILLAAEES